MSMSKQTMVQGLIDDDRFIVKSYNRQRMSLKI